MYVRKTKMVAQDIFLFQHLSKKQMADVVRVISREQVQKGDTVIKQGDEGDKFYIVDAGEFDVRTASWCQRTACVQNRNAKRFILEHSAPAT